MSHFTRLPDLMENFSQRWFYIRNDRIPIHFCHARLARRLQCTCWNPVPSRDICSRPARTCRTFVRCGNCARDDVRCEPPRTGTKQGRRAPYKFDAADYDVEHELYMLYIKLVHGAVGVMYFVLSWARADDPCVALGYMVSCTCCSRRSPSCSRRRMGGDQVSLDW